MKSKQVTKKEKKGFTLLELLVAMAIFVMVSVVMSNIIITNVRFALDVQRRTKFVSELDRLANNIKNSMRVSGALCTNLGIPKYIYARDPNGDIKRLVVNADHRIAWQYVDKNNCTTVLNRDLVPLTSSFIRVHDMKVSSVSTIVNPGLLPSNTMVFVSVEACDENNIVFDCTNNPDLYRPYRFKFGVSTKYE